MSPRMALLTLAWALCGASQARCAEREIEGCFNLSNDQVVACIEPLHQRSEDELDATVQGIRARLKEDLQLFDAAQRAWLEFRSRECAVQSVTTRGYRDPERQKALFLLACQVELNNARIQGLKRLQLYCDNCLH
ncbi:lysozyme inhibitor LprI family protein [Metapseudomonas otitidis]|uniref:lysozyme inhibitor LprI family protein n=1 Tax=Metapseudomonas otitidis TaxID=319939 RepID=UPI001F0F572D|nr:lysozyme inhibitor LprI family protein [Pseudomonas otitidis]